MKYKLTDFNSDEWDMINMESVQMAVGELDHPENSEKLIGYLRSDDNNTENINDEIIGNFKLENLEVKDKCVYGEINHVYKLDASIDIKSMMEKSELKFGIRASGVKLPETGELIVHEIYGWDIIL